MTAAGSCQPNSSINTLEPAMELTNKYTLRLLSSLDSVAASCYINLMFTRFTVASEAHWSAVEWYVVDWSINLFLFEKYRDGIKLKSTSKDASQVSWYP